MKDAPAKISMLLIYAAALASLFLDWPARLEQVLQIGSLAFLAVHAIEVVVSWRWV